MMSNKKKLSAPAQKRYLKSALISGTLMLGAFMMRRGFEAGYKAMSGEDAPKNPSDKHAGWAKALVWGMATGALLGATKTLLRPGVSTGVNKILPD